MVEMNEIFKAVGGTIEDAIEIEDLKTENEQLKKENEKLFSVYEDCRSDNTAHFRKIMELQKENEQLKSKLKVAVKAIHDLFNKAKDGSHYESIAREALKEIGGEI